MLQRRHPAALLGVIVGGIIGFFLDYLRDVLQTKKSTRRLAVALLSESVALRDRYNEVFANYIRRWPVGQPPPPRNEAQEQQFSKSPAQRAHRRVGLNPVLSERAPIS